ncbi:MAG: hypothetical protein EON47_16440 [Acetobacteraceae bacterium]|nr:MAG: hypothetical protein EON47_16440 [Acetobacteraceae bacterium]
MPMRAYRASSAHVTNNLLLWIGISLAVTIAFGLGVWQNPGSNIWGHLTAAAGMFAGTLVMIQSQVGYVPPVYATADDDLPPMA